jgi:hypothetical protein
MPELYVIGEEFPGPIPSTEGIVMEMGPDGDLNVLIQAPGVTREERKAFQKSFKHYYYYETPTEIPLALWLFDFPAPLNALEVNFDGALQSRIRPGSLETFMETDGVSMKNALSFYLLDGNILKGIKLFGLHLDALRRFHGTIRKQVAIGYDKSAYAVTLDGVYRGMDQDVMKRVGVRFP